MLLRNCLMNNSAYYNARDHEEYYKHITTSIYKRKLTILNKENAVLIKYLKSCSRKEIKYFKRWTIYIAPIWVQKWKANII